MWSIHTGVHLGQFGPEREDSTILQNVVNCSSTDVASDPRTHEIKIHVPLQAVKAYGEVEV
jgi:hypothetical protein